MARKSKEQKEKEQLSLYNSYRVNYKKSNTLINAKGRVPLLGLKIFTISIINATYNPEDNSIWATVYTPQLREMIGNKSGSLYTHVREQINPKSKNEASILDWRIIYEDKKSKEISASNVITDASFKNGALRVKFNNSLKDYIIDLSKGFTMLNCQEQFSLTSQYSFRLYELCKQNLDQTRYLNSVNGINSDGPITWTIDLTELKLQLGIIDHQASPKIRDMLLKGSEDYDEIENLALNDSTTRRYKTYGSFKQNALSKAVNEINEKTSISVDFEEIKAGRGGKVKQVKFIVDYKKKEEPVVEKEQAKVLSEDDMDRIIDDIDELTGGKLRLSECKAIAKAAEYDFKKVEAAYFLAKKSASKIDNLTGWMVSAIKNEYKESRGDSIGGKFTNFEQRSFSFEDLESQILDN